MKPLADLIRPTQLSEVCGQQHILGENKILDRIVKVEVPYCLELDEEVKIYRKMLKSSNFEAHIAPHQE